MYITVKLSTFSLFDMDFASHLLTGLLLAWLTKRRSSSNQLNRTYQHLLQRSRTINWFSLSACILRQGQCYPCCVCWELHWLATVWYSSFQGNYVELCFSHGIPLAKDCHITLGGCHLQKSREMSQKHRNSHFSSELTIEVDKCWRRRDCQ